MDRMTQVAFCLALHVKLVMPARGLSPLCQISPTINEHRELLSQLPRYIAPLDYLYLSSLDSRILPPNSHELHQ
jgi:hypothetical protein